MSVRLSSRGFSLVELLTTLALVALLAGIVAPRFRVTPATRVRQAARQLAADVELVRLRALGTKSRARLALDAAGATYTAYLDDDRDGVIAETIAERAALRGFGARDLAASEIRFGVGSADLVPDHAGSGPITFANARLDFDRRGIPEPLGTSGVVYLVHARDANAVAAVTVSAAGGVRSWTWTEGAWR